MFREFFYIEYRPMIVNQFEIRPGQSKEFDLLGFLSDSDLEEYQIIPMLYNDKTEIYGISWEEMRLSKFNSDMTWD